VLKLHAIKRRRWSYSSLSAGLLISISEAHAGVQRAVASHLLDPDQKLPIVQSVEEFLIFGLRYTFPVQLGGLVRGMPTGYGGPPLRCRNLTKDQPPPVWQDHAGEVLGYECPPIYSSAPAAAKSDTALYELLALADVMRIGSPRERGLIGDILVKRLRNF
jgi:hypothetical protein